MDSQAVIPVGATAWGEVVSFDSSGAVGKGGKLGVRVLYLDLPEGRLPLKGKANQRGIGNGAGSALANVGFGLFSAGDSARFKGGDQLTVFEDLAWQKVPKSRPPPKGPRHRQFLRSLSSAKIAIALVATSTIALSYKLAFVKCASFASRKKWKSSLSCWLLVSLLPRDTG